MARVVSKSIWVLVFCVLIGCQTSQVKLERLRLVEHADDVVLCYSLVDGRFELDQNAVLRELKKREIETCLDTIAEHECPKTKESGQSCVEETKVRVMAELRAVQSAAGTELLIKGFQVGIGVLPF